MALTVLYVPYFRSTADLGFDGLDLVERHVVHYPVICFASLLVHLGVGGVGFNSKRFGNQIYQTERSFVAY